VYAASTKVWAVVGTDDEADADAEADAETGAGADEGEDDNQEQEEAEVVTAGVLASDDLNDVMMTTFLSLFVNMLVLTVCCSLLINSVHGCCS
jgi:hypothetical protein